MFLASTNPKHLNYLCREVLFLGCEKEHYFKRSFNQFHMRVLNENELDNFLMHEPL
jgi:hypothetical protein